MTQLDGTVVEVEGNDAEVVHGVGGDGRYLGLVDVADAHAVSVGPPPDARAGWRWADQWLYDQPLSDAKTEAQTNIDAAAGMVRLRYITDVPGQAATYAEKRTQADAYVAAPDGPVPPFVQAEADAMGVTPLQAAQYILATAQAWEQIGPAIERERRRGKLLVGAAATLGECQTLLAAALDALGAL